MFNGLISSIASFFRQNQSTVLPTPGIAEKIQGKTISNKKLLDICFLPPHVSMPRTSSVNPSETSVRGAVFFSIFLLFQVVFSGTQILFDNITVRHRIHIGIYISDGTIQAQGSRGVLDSLANSTAQQRITDPLLQNAIARFSKRSSPLFVCSSRTIFSLVVSIAQYVCTAINGTALFLACWLDSRRLSIVSRTYFFQRDLPAISLSTTLNDALVLVVFYTAQSNLGATISLVNCDAIDYWRPYTADQTINVTYRRRRSIQPSRPLSRYISSHVIAYSLVPALTTPL